MMGSLVSLLIYGAIAAAVVGAAYGAIQGFRGWVAAPYVEAQKASDQKFVDAASANAKAAELERDNAKDDTKACLTISAKQTDLINAWKAAAEANAKAVQEAKAKASREATAAAPRIAELQALAGAAPKLQACEVELREVDKILGDQLRKARGLPTTAAPAAPAVQSPPVLVK